MSIFDNIDIVIHSGDESNSKNPHFNLTECEDFLNWYNGLPVKYKIFVAGNHSTAIEAKLINFNDYPEIIYLENTWVTIEGINIYGTPYTPSYGNWSFMLARHKIQRVWDLIPEGMDILVVHGPPKGIRDLSYSNEGKLEFCGDKCLLNTVLKLKPKYCLFGHIHDHKDIVNQGVSTYSYTPTVFSNAACVEDGKMRISSYGNKFVI
jgi:Icc-related predicted phosphoesterase